MNIEEFREFCLSLEDSEETLPFGPDTLVYKTSGKMFALIGLEDPNKANLKCDPERAIQLREEYSDSVFPGWHMNKTHWNTVHFNLSLSDNLLKELILHSYSLVREKKSKKNKN